MLEKLDNIVSGDNTDGHIAFIDHFGLVLDEERWGEYVSYVFTCVFFADLPQDFHCSRICYVLYVNTVNSDSET